MNNNSKVEALLLSANARAWKIEAKDMAGISYKGTFLMNGQVIEFKTNKETCEILEKHKEKYGVFEFNLVNEQNDKGYKLLKVVVVSFQPSK